MVRVIVLRIEHIIKVRNDKETSKQITLKKVMY